MVYSFSGPPATLTYSSEYSTVSEVCNLIAGAEPNFYTATEVGTVSTAFPFYINEVPTAVPLLPLWAFGTIAGGIVLSGGAIAMRRRQ